MEHFKFWQNQRNAGAEKSALDAINARRLYLLVQRSIAEVLEAAGDRDTGAVTLEDAKTAIQAVATHYANMVGGEIVSVDKVWQPKYAVVLTNRRGSRVFVSDDEANCKGLKRVFTGRRLARVWAKRRWNWNSLVFADLTYRDPRPIERIVVNITV